MEFCRACGAELLAVTPVCPKCGEDNTPFMPRITAPSFKPAAVPPLSSADAARSEAATEVTPPRVPSGDFSGLLAYPCVEAPAVTMPGGVNAMPGAPQTLDQLAESLLAVEDPFHRPPVLHQPMAEGGGGDEEGARGRGGADEPDGSRRSSTQPGGPMPPDIEAAIHQGDAARIEEQARATVAGLVDVLDEALSVPGAPGGLQDQEQISHQGHEQASGVESFDSVDRSESSGVERAATEPSSAIGLPAVAGGAQEGVSFDAEVEGVTGDVVEVSPSSLDEEVEVVGLVTELRMAPVAASSDPPEVAPASPESGAGPVASSGVVKPASGGGGKRVVAVVGLLVVLVVFVGVSLGGLYVFAPGLFNGEVDVQRDGGGGEAAAKPQEERAESRGGADERRTKTRTRRKGQAARQKDKGEKPRSKENRSKGVKGEGGQRRAEEKAGKKGREVRGESGQGVDERSVLNALLLSEVVSLRSFRAERFKGFVHGADLDNRLHADTWAVVQLAGVDVLVVPMLPGVDPVATGRLVAKALREAALNHQKKGGRVSVFEIGEAFQLVWQSAGEHDAIPLISLEFEALTAIGRFDANGEVTPRQRAEALARWCGWMLDTVVLQRVPDAVKDKSLRRALKEMVDVSGPEHAETLPRSVRARLNQEAYLVSR